MDNVNLCVRFEWMDKAMVWQVQINAQLNSAERQIDGEKFLKMTKIFSYSMELISLTKTLVDCTC